MTDREKAIVMAYTGRCMLTGDKFKIFHKYVDDIMGRPIWTDDIGWLEDEIKERSKADFMALCADEDQTEWIPVSERLPKPGEYVGDVAKYYIVQNEYGDMMVARYYYLGQSEYWEQIYQIKPIEDEIVAWRELPQPYKAESEERKNESC